MDGILNFLQMNGPLILLYMAGMGLMLLEVLIPGVSIAGLLGGLALLGAVAWTWIEYGPIAGVIALTAVLAATVTLLVTSYRSLLSGRLARSPMVLSEVSSPGDAAQKQNSMLGCVGVALSPLRPGGSARFNGEVFQVCAQNGYIEKGSAVRVCQVHGAMLIVTEKMESE